MTILTITVGEPIESSLLLARETARALQRGDVVSPVHRVGFEDMGQLLGVFTPQRWALIAALRACGPVTIADLARRLGRDYKNVHTDIAALGEWWAVERGDDGKVSVPWSEIVVDLKLPEQEAA
jgi:predicted transcriptional regulator